MADTIRVFIDHQDGTYAWQSASAGQANQFLRGDGTYDIGAQGFQGEQGNQGFQGLQGSQGNQGSTGSGAQGSQGAQGSPGAQGFQGAAGTGAQGSQGAPGAQGNQGSQGTGVSGNQTLTSCGFTIPNSGAAITGKIGGYFTCPYAGTISAWNIVVDAGTATIKVWKIATGTAKPTAANSINTSGVAISTGTAIHSTTTSDFTSTTVTANDIFAFNIEAISGVSELSFNLQITKS